MGNFLEDPEGNKRIALRCILGKQFVKIGGGWIWLKILSSTEISY
jgi:hypothetical protein